MMMFVMLLQLTLNYLSTQKKINFGLNLLPQAEVPEPKLDLTGAQLVFDMAKYAQMFLEIAADIMEKVKHLFLWTRPIVTTVFYGLILAGFISSLFVPMRMIFTGIGLGLGIKLFVTTYLFHRFPRLQHKLDVAILFLDRLPTDSELKYERKIEKTIEVHRTGSTEEIVEKIEINRNQDEASLKHDLEVVADDAAVPTDIDDMQKAARSCVLVDKEKKFLRNMANGTLALTYTSLIFTYHRLHKGKQEVIRIPFDAITSVKKTHTIKHFHLLPGGGHALEVFVENREKPYHFVGIGNRDEFFDELVKCSDASGHPVLLSENSIIE